MQETPCCPRFDPQPWDGKTNEWNEKPFLAATMPVLFHMPFPRLVNRTMTRLWQRAQEYSIAPDMEDFLLLVHDPSPWKSRYYLAVTGVHPDLEKDMVTFSGNLHLQGFDGPYNDVPKSWRRQMPGCEA